MLAGMRDRGHAGPPALVKAKVVSSTFPYWSSAPWRVSFMRYAGAWECAAGIGCVVVASIRPWTASLPSSSACLPARRSIQWQRRRVSAHATSSRSASCLSVLAVDSLRRTIQYSSTVVTTILPLTATPLHLHPKPRALSLFYLKPCA